MTVKSTLEDSSDKILFELAIIICSILPCIVHAFTPAIPPFLQFQTGDRRALQQTNIRQSGHLSSYNLVD